MLSIAVTPPYILEIWNFILGKKGMLLSFMDILMMASYFAILGTIFILKRSWNH